MKKKKGPNCQTQKWYSRNDFRGILYLSLTRFGKLIAVRLSRHVKWDVLNCSARLEVLVVGRGGGGRFDIIANIRKLRARLDWHVH